MIDLSNKTALVTGGGRGIGRAIALRLADAGANVVVNYVSTASAAKDTASEVLSRGVRAAVVKADVSVRDDVESMCSFIKEEFGALDILVSNAATGGFRPLLAATDRNFDAAMGVNVKPLMYLVQSAVNLMDSGEHRSKVVVLSSHGAHMALPMYGTIGASKAALEALCRHFALELGDRGINFNVVRAGLVATDSTSRLPGADEMFAGRIHKSMTGDRLLEARDVADAVLFLASPLSDLIQGTTVTVDGGADIHI